MKLLVVLLLATIPLSAFAQRASTSRSPSELYSDALTARNQKNFERAVSLLRDAVKAQPGRSEYQLALGETLGWLKQFDEAESVYREAVRRFPDSSAAKAGLGQILLWKGDYRQARKSFEAALATSPASLAAREGLATAAYWNGDYRTARRESRRILAGNPSHPESLRTLAEIEQAMVPAYGIGAVFRTDDQPYRMIRSEAALALFSDPITKWTITGGGYALENRDSGLDARVPFAELSVDTKVAGAELDVRARARFVRFPDDESSVLPALSLSRNFSTAGRVTVFYDESELLFSERSLESHPSVEAFGVRWSRESKERWSGAASARSLRYFDDNTGLSTDAWMLIRLRNTEQWSVSAGPAVSYRDTDQSRFRAVPGTADGVYDPYWTPRELIEGRGVLAITWQARRINLHVHGDAGFARDEVVDLSTSLEVSRTFQPWSVSITARSPLGSRIELTAALRRESTVFYEANEIRAGLAGRF